MTTIPCTIQLPTAPRNVAALTLVAVLIAFGWLWALAAVPVLLVALVAQFVWFTNQFEGTRPAGCRLPLWQELLFSTRVALTPHRWAMCRCCGGIKRAPAQASGLGCG